MFTCEEDTVPPFNVSLSKIFPTTELAVDVYVSSTASISGADTTTVTVAVSQIVVDGTQIWYVIV